MANENEKIQKINLFSGSRNPSGQNPFGFMNNQNGRSLAQSSFSQKQRINDYDSSILDNRSYLDMDDEMSLVGIIMMLYDKDYYWRQNDGN